MTHTMSRLIMTLMTSSLLLLAACGGGNAAIESQPPETLVALCSGETVDGVGQNPLNQIAYFIQEAPDSDFVPMDPTQYPLDENRIATSTTTAQYVLCAAFTASEELGTCDNNGTEIPRFSANHTFTLYEAASGEAIGELESEAVYAACPTTYPEGVTALYPLPNMPEINAGVDTLIEGTS